MVSGEHPIKENILNVGSIALAVDVKSWEEAVRAAGGLLLKNGYITADYIDDMIEMVKTLGPYIVISPGLAMPHSKRGKNVIKSGISVVTLKHPVNFGNKTNDPVHMLVGLAGCNDDLHLKILQTIADLFEDENYVYEMCQWNDKQKIADVFNGKEV